MKRITLAAAAAALFMPATALAAAAAALFMPATALASTSSGVVLSVSARQHTIQVVDSSHVVHLYRVRGAVRGLHLGSRISFTQNGSQISRISSRSGATVSFYARVVHSSASGLVLVAGDGNTVTLSSRQLSGAAKGSRVSGHRRRGHHRTRAGRAHRRQGVLAHVTMGVTAGSVTINLLGLQPGVTVLVTESTDSAGNLTVTITLPPATQAPQSQQASGVVSEVDSDAFVIQTADGSQLRLHMAQQTLSNLNLSTCNTVDVTYHQDAGMLIADNVQITGTSTTGDCTPTQDATGTITVLTDQQLTISTSQGPMTFSADPSLTGGFYDGDLVDVTYVQNPDGSLTATDVEYVESDASGTVTAVTPTSLTITDSNTGQPDTFVADPNQGVQISAQTFAGVQVGDSVDVNYHQSAAGWIADCVNDNGPAGTNGNTGNGNSDN